MRALLYKGFVLLILFSGGYVLLRFGMMVSERTSFWLAFVVFPALVFGVWLIGYRGKKFK